MLQERTFAIPNREEEAFDKLITDLWKAKVFVRGDDDFITVMYDIDKADEVSTILKDAEKFVHDDNGYIE